jgi:hypothetical protein
MPRVILSVELVINGVKNMLRVNHEIAKIDNKKFDA